jgi:hypothetical protein
MRKAGMQEAVGLLVFLFSSLLKTEDTVQFCSAGFALRLGNSRFWVARPEPAEAGTTQRACGLRCGAWISLASRIASGLQNELKLGSAFHSHFLMRNAGGGWASFVSVFYEGMDGKDRLV